MTELTLHQRTVRTVFDLLGSKENDITYSLGWGLANSDSMTAELLADIGREVGIAEPGPLVRIRLQEHIRGTGYTDIEILTERAHVIVEAKRGWSIPSVDQLEKYAASLRPDRAGALLIAAEGSRSFASGRYPTSVHGREGVSVPVAYRSWRQLTTLAAATADRVRSTNEKRLLRDLIRYLRSLMSSQAVRDNMVYVVALGAPTAWGSVSPRDVVLKDFRYFHPVGGSRGGWPKEPYNYLGFRFDGKLQQINHVERVEVDDHPYPHVPSFPADEEWDRPFYIYYLGPTIRPLHTVKSGRVKRALRVEAALDLLLTCDTISDARDQTKQRLSEAGA